PRAADQRLVAVDQGAGQRPARPLPGPQQHELRGPGQRPGVEAHLREGLVQRAVVAEGDGGGGRRGHRRVEGLEGPGRLGGGPQAQRAEQGRHVGVARGAEVREADQQPVGVGVGQRHGLEAQVGPGPGLERGL
ncbi:MAG: hypothetical protein ACK559_08750, partial [bacterium]